MSDQRDPVGDIDSITDPLIPPGDIPDPATAREIKRTKQQSNRLTPTELHSAACREHIKDACDERTNIRKELTGFRLECSKSIANLQKELGEIRPAYAALQEAYAGILNVNIFSTVMVGVGGSLISGAGYGPNDIWKVAILFSGIFTFIWGTILQVASTWRNIRRGASKLPNPIE